MGSRIISLDLPLESATLIAHQLREEGHEVAVFDFGGAYVDIDADDHGLPESNTRWVRLLGGACRMFVGAAILCGLSLALPFLLLFLPIVAIPGALMSRETREFTRLWRGDVPEGRVVVVIVAYLLAAAVALAIVGAPDSRPRLFVTPAQEQVL